MKALGEADSPPYGGVNPPIPAWSDCVVITSLAADLLVGGNGVDRVSYAWHDNPVVADLDGVIGDDGSAGEGDTILGVEGLIGGGDNDTLVGNDGPNYLNGQGGNDNLYGLADGDTLVGFLETTTSTARPDLTCSTATTASIPATLAATACPSPVARPRGTVENLTTVDSHGVAKDDRPTAEPRGCRIGWPRLVSGDASAAGSGDRARGRGGGISPSGAAVGGRRVHRPE